MTDVTRSDLERAAAIREYLAEQSPETILFDGLDKALIGVGTRFTHVHAIYSEAKIIRIFNDDGATGDDAREWLEHSTAGTWAGDLTPVILRDFDAPWS